MLAPMWQGVVRTLLVNTLEGARGTHVCGIVTRDAITMSLGSLLRAHSSHMDDQLECCLPWGLLCPQAKSGTWHTAGAEKTLSD